MDQKISLVVCRDIENLCWFFLSLLFVVNLDKLKFVAAFGLVWFVLFCCVNFYFNML